MSDLNVVAAVATSDAEAAAAAIATLESVGTGGGVDAEEAEAAAAAIAMLDSVGKCCGVDIPVHRHTNKYRRRCKRFRQGLAGFDIFFYVIKC